MFSPIPYKYVDGKANVIIKNCLATVSPPREVSKLLMEKLEFVLLVCYTVQTVQLVLYMTVFDERRLIVKSNGCPFFVSLNDKM